MGSLLSESTNIPALFHLPLARVLRPAQEEAKGMQTRRGLVPAIREEHGDQESPCPQLSEQELTKRGEGDCSRSQVPAERDQAPGPLPCLGHSIQLLLPFLFNRGIQGTSYAQALF